MTQKKNEFIKKYGEAAWQKVLAQNRAWRKAHREEAKAIDKKYREEHREKVIANDQERGRKGGKHYDKHLEYNHTGLPGKRNRIRANHGTKWRPFKNIIAPESLLHHEWIPKTAKYRGVALVEKEPHQYGIIDVIQILDGKITLLTEEEVRKGKNKMCEKMKQKRDGRQKETKIRDAIVEDIRR